MKNIKVLFLVFVLILVGGAAIGAIPQKINYQGRLTNSGGVPLNGAYNFSFSIYADASGGSALWTEARTVSVTNGVYSITLGENTAVSVEVFDGSERYLGVTVGGDSEMTPRMKIVSVANAFKAYDSDLLGGQPASYYASSTEGDYVEKAGDTMTGVLTSAGISMGEVTTSTSLNRIHMNTTEAWTNYSVISVGGEWDGGIEGTANPGSYKTQIFAQSKDDGTEFTVHPAIVGYADARRNKEEVIGVLGVAHGPGDWYAPNFSVAGVGGTDTEDIVGFFAGAGYSQKGIYLDQKSLTGFGFDLTMSDGASSGEAIILNTNGDGDLLVLKNDDSVRSGINNAGQLYFRDANEDKIYFNDDAGNQKISKLSGGIEIRNNTNAITLEAGRTTLGQVLISGIVTADAFVGDGSNLTGLTSGMTSGEGDDYYVNINGDTMSGILTIEAPAYLIGNVTVGSGETGVDYAINFDGESNDGIITWDEDLGRFIFSKSIEIDSVNKLYLMGNNSYIDSPSNGVMRLKSSTSVDLYAQDTLMLQLTSMEADLGGGDSGIDYALNFNGETNDGSITWMEDENRFAFSNEVTVEGNITADKISINGSTGMEFNVLSDVWAFRYANDLGYDGTGLYFDVLADGRYEIKIASADCFTTNNTETNVFGKLVIDAGAGDAIFQMDSNTASGYLTFDDVNEDIKWNFAGDLDLDDSNLTFDTGYGDKISLYDDRIDLSSNYGFGVQSNTLQIKSGNTTDILNNGNLAARFELDGDWVLGSGDADKDYSLTFDGENNDGVITFMEDENYFNIANALTVDGNTTLGNATSDVTNINDILRIVPRATAPYTSSTPEGTCWMDSGTNKFRVYLNSTWNDCF